MELPVYVCRRTPVPIEVDGVMDDVGWKSANEVEFVLAQTGEPATRPVTARMCWDEKHLYIGFKVVDKDIWSTFTKHDEPLYREEVVEAFVEPDGDLKDYYEFNFSPRNIVFDARITNTTGSGAGTTPDVSWDCQGLRSAVVVKGDLEKRDYTDEGWTVEVAIPFASIGGAPTPGDRWRLNLYRIDRTPTEEYSAWSPTLKDPADFHVPGRFGIVEFA